MLQFCVVSHVIVFLSNYGRDGWFFILLKKLKKLAIFFIFVLITPHMKKQFLIIILHGMVTGKSCRFGKIPQTNVHNLYKFKH